MRNKPTETKVKRKKTSRIAWTFFLGLVLFILVLAWIFRVGDICTFCWEGAQLESKLPQGGVEIPVENKSGWLFVNGIINGTKPVHLLVDTGCTECYLDQSWRSDLKPFFLPSKKIESPGGCSKGNLAIVPELKLGSLTFHSVPVTVDNFHSISCQNGYKIDGMVGRTLLDHFAVTFDYKHNKLIFENSDKVKALPGTYKIQHASFIAKGPIVSAKINNSVTQDFLVDTGANASQIPLLTANELGLHLYQNGWLSHISYMNGNTRNSARARVSKFSLGELQTQDMWLSVDLSGENCAMLGNDFLKNFRVTLNAKKSELWLSPCQFDSETKFESELSELINAGLYPDALRKSDIELKKKETSDLRLLRSIAMFQLQKYKDLIKESSRSIQLGCKAQEIYFGRAIAYSKLHQPNLAIQAILKVSAMSPSDAFTQWRCGQALSDISAYRQAIDIFNQALKLQTDITDIYLGRAIASEALKEYKNGLYDCNTAIKLDPKREDCYNTRAWVRNAMNTGFDKSIEDCNKAINLDPHFAAAYRNRGIAFMGKGDYANALTDLNKSLELDSTSERAARTYYFRSIVYEKLGKNDLAKVDKNKSKQLNYNPQND